MRAPSECAYSGSRVNKVISTRPDEDRAKSSSPSGIINRWTSEAYPGVANIACTRRPSALSALPAKRHATLLLPGLCRDALCTYVRFHRTLFYFSLLNLRFVAVHRGNRRKSAVGAGARSRGWQLAAMPLLVLANVPVINNAIHFKHQSVTTKANQLKIEIAIFGTYNQYQTRLCRFQREYKFYYWTNAQRNFKCDEIFKRPQSSRIFYSYLIRHTTEFDVKYKQEFNSGTCMNWKIGTLNLWY